MHQLTQTPDYRYTLIRLLDKIRRNHQYYLAIASTQEAKSRRTDLPDDERIECASKADSLRRCASDLDFMYKRSVHRLTAQDQQDIENFNRQDYHDRNHSLSATSASQN